MTQSSSPRVNVKPTNNTALVTHRGCLDGTGSALMFMLAGGKRENILFCNPSGCILKDGELLPNIDEVWYADCCPDDLTNPACGLPFKVFDHHASNQKKHCNDSRCIFDMTKSGTSLIAAVLGHDDKKFFNEATRVINAIEAYDLGRFDNKDGQQLADLAASYSQEELLTHLYNHWWCSDRIWEYACFLIRSEAMKFARDVYSTQAANNAHYSTILVNNIKIKAGTAVSPVHWKNDTAMKILNSGKADLAVLIDPTSQMISLRSLAGGPDCSIIAAAYNGGGHACAAGFKANGQAMLKSLIDEVLG